jgi:hypothetical protein
MERSARTPSRRIAVSIDADRFHPCLCGPGAGERPAVGGEDAVNEQFVEAILADFPEAKILIQRPDEAYSSHKALRYGLDWTSLRA